MEPIAHDNSSNTQTFADLGLSQPILEAIEKAGYELPTPVQLEAIPEVLKQTDMVVRAQTGSGKTAAFALPALELMQNRAKKKGCGVVVLVPTRELANQVVDEFKKFSRNMRLSVVGVVGGQSMTRQIDAIQKGADIIVATPGRMLDHLKSGRFKQFAPEIVVLDEADEMLDMGFIEDIREILSFSSSESRQTLLFSATMPPSILKLTREYLVEPQEINLIDDKNRHADIEQLIYLVKLNEKDEALTRLIEFETPEKGIIFCKTKQDTEQLTEKLQRKNIRAMAIHGDLRQAARNKAVEDLRRQKISLLVATDVASRGLDISGVSHVFNYHFPENIERYTHRIGRTGRAGQKGKAITLATPYEVRSSFALKKKLRQDFKVSQVPLKADLMAKKSEALFEKIATAPVSQSSQEILEKLKAQGDLEDFASKMITLLAGRNTVYGPDRIGLDDHEIENLKSSANERSRNRGYRGGSSFRGGNRSNGNRSADGNRGGRRSHSFNNRGPKRGRFSKTAHGS